MVADASLAPDVQPKAKIFISYSRKDVAFAGSAGSHAANAGLRGSVEDLLRFDALRMITPTKRGNLTGSSQVLRQGTRAAISFGRPLLIGCPASYALAGRGLVDADQISATSTMA